MSQKPVNLKQDPVHKLFLHYSLLSIAGLAAMSVNIMIDGVFIGHFVGSMGLAAINLVLPLFPFFLAIGMCFGYGGAALIGISFGKGDIPQANRIFSHSFLGTMVVGVTVTLLLELFPVQIVNMLGATKNLAPDVTIYLRTFSAFAVFFCLTLFLEPIARNDGAPKLVMWSLILGALSNTCMGALFIVVLRWGVFGAALATGLSQVVSFAFLVAHFLRKRGQLHFRKDRISWSLLLLIVKTGSPTLFTQAGQAVFIMVYNWVILHQIGELGIAALSIIFYMNELIMLCIYGFGEALQPIASFNLGARCYDRMRKTFRTAVSAELLFSAIFTILIMAAPGFFVGLFTSEPALTELAVHAVRLYYAGLLIQGFNMIVIYYLESVSKPLESTTLTIMRNIGWFVVVVQILPRLIGEPGIWLAVTVSDLITALFVLWIIWKNKFYFKASA